MTLFRMLPDKRRLSWALALSLAAASAQAAGMVDLLNLAFDSNPSLQSQANLVRASQAEVKGANWQFFPTPSVSVEQVSASNQDTSYNKDSRVITFRLQQPLWTAGRLTAGVGRAERQRRLRLPRWKKRACNWRCAPYRPGANGAPVIKNLWPCARACRRTSGWSL
jgi:outer membrane protein TolC